MCLLEVSSYYIKESLNYIFGQVLKMKLLLVIILYLHLLQQQDAAPFDDIKEKKWNDESPPYDYNMPAENSDATDHFHNPKLHKKSHKNMEDKGQNNKDEFRAKSTEQWEDGLDATSNNNQWNTDKENVKKRPMKVSMQARCTHHLSDVNTKQYSSDVMVGGGGGGFRSINVNGEKQGRLVRSIQFWLHVNRYLRMGIELTDGSTHSCGSLAGVPSETFYFRPDERITYLNIYTEKDNCDGQVGGVSFSTNKGRHFSYRGNNSPHRYQTRSVGSGILVGFKARCGANVDALAFLFLQKVESSTLTHVHYTNINSLSILEKPFHINGMKCNNKGRKVEQEFTLSGSRSVNEIHQWSLGTTSLEAQLSNTRVKSSIASITMPTGTSLTSNLAMSSPYYHGRELNISSTQNYAFNIKVPPGKEVIATATAYQGVIETPYTGRLTVKLITGRTFNYQVTGVYRSKTTSNVVVSTKDII